MEERFFSPVGEKVRSQKRRKERRGRGPELDQGEEIERFAGRHEPGTHRIAKTMECHIFKSVNTKQSQHKSE
jgi:hypothetical protein